jgi:hypothetical protein
VVKEARREADARICGATRSLAWGISAVVIVSPLTKHVTALERLNGFRYSKSLELDSAPCALDGDRDSNSLWVGCTNGDLLRLTNTELQPAEVGRVNLGVRVSWVALGKSATGNGRLRSTSARRHESVALDDRILDVRSDLMVFAPSDNGIRVFNSRLDGLVEMGEIQGVPSYEAGAFDPTTGCLFLASARGDGAVILVNPDNSLTTLAVLEFPNVQGAIQARVIGSALHVICEARNRWLTWDISDPEAPVLAADDTYDAGLYWERNPVRWVTATGDLLRRSDSWLDFVPANLPITDGGTAYQSITDEPFRWALHGEVGQITWDQKRGVLPFRVFLSGGLTSSPMLKVGCLPRPVGSIAAPTDPAITVELVGSTSGGVTEAAAYDAEDTEVFSRIVYRVGTQNPPLTNPITIGYYDCLEGLVTHQGGRNEQYPSDGSNIVRTKMPYVIQDVRARVSVGPVPTFTTSLSGFFQNPADPLVSVTRYWQDQDRTVTVELAAAVPVGQVITIQDTSYPSGTTEVAGFVRKVLPTPHFPVLASAARAYVPATESSYGSDTSGHTPGVYRFWWKSGSFFDPNTGQYFVFNLDNASRIGIRHILAQPYSAIADLSWTQLSPLIDAALTEDAAQALAAAQQGLVFAIAAPSQCRLGAGLITPPVGCTGSVELFVQALSPWPYP